MKNNKMKMIKIIIQIKKMTIKQALNQVNLLKNNLKKEKVKLKKKLI